MDNQQPQLNSHRLRGAAVTTTFIVFALALFVGALISPKYNWDTIPYLALMLDDGQMDATELHERTFSLVRKSVSPKDWSRLTEQSSYRIRQANDPAAFASMLPLYRVKIGYVYTLKFFGLIFDPIFSMLVSSGLFASLSAISILALLKSIKSDERSLVIIPIAILAGAVDVARISTPDSMFSFLIITSICLLFMEKHFYSALTLAISTTIRPEATIFLFSILTCLILSRRGSYHYIFAFVASVVIYGVIAYYVGHPGWWTHFYFTNVEIQDTINGFEPTFNLFTYVTALASGVAKSLVFSNWPHLITLLLIILVIHGYYRDWRSDGGLIISAIFMFILLRIFVFPLPLERFYFPYTVLLYVSALSLYTTKCRESRGRTGNSHFPDR